MEIADQYILRVKDLPPAPTVALELLELLANPNQRVDQFVDLIRHDPALTAKVMQRCNSVYFNRGSPASDLFEVIMRLGFYEVYTVVATQLGNDLMRLGQSAQPQSHRLWQHSVITAVAASELAKRLELSAALPFTAGLLHDLGKQILATVEAAKYTQLLNVVAAQGLNQVAQEQEIFGVDHAALGARLLSRWGLPESLVTAAAQHHAAPVAEPPLVTLIQLANALAHQLAGEVSAPDRVERKSPELLELLGLLPPEVPSLLAQIQVKLQRVEGFSLPPAATGG